ncbi:hypothetical protein J2Y66_004312, partial [Paenarthrobacter nitroguajacolicus]|uniref:hypothetical protein n=1 Tax=Paenarthrobacter nitroguajacolicus TaxID=211146 RepID=UPI00285E6652
MSLNYRTGRLRIVLGIVFTAFLIFGLMPQIPAVAATDTAPPVLVTSTVSPKTFNLSTGPATVKVTL